MAESIAEFFTEHFRAHRHECAYRQRRGYRTESFSYGEVLEMAFGFARKLEARGIAKGDRVMLWGENCAEWVAVFFGCALSGVIAVPMDDGAAADFAMRVFRVRAERGFFGKSKRNCWSGRGGMCTNAQRRDNRSQRSVWKT